MCIPFLRTKVKWPDKKIRWHETLNQKKDQKNYHVWAIKQLILSVPVRLTWHEKDDDEGIENIEPVDLAISSGKVYVPPRGPFDGTLLPLYL